MARKKPDLIFSVTDFFGNLVDLHRATWEEHIVVPEGHPQMAGYENLVQQVLQDPSEIWTSSIHQTSAVFVSGPLIGPSAEGIRAVVDYKNMTYEKGATTGVIATAYPIDLVAYPTSRLRKRIYKKNQ